MQSYKNAKYGLTYVFGGRAATSERRGRPAGAFKKGGDILGKKKAKAAEHTSYEVRRRWDIENQKIYSFRLRLKDDADLIEYIESHKADVGTSQLFREILQKYINEG